MKKIILLASLAALVAHAESFNFVVQTDPADAVAKVGERVTYTVTAYTADWQLATKGSYPVVLDNFGALTNLAKTIEVAKENPAVITGALDRPGFLRLRITEKAALNPTYADEFVWGVAVSPEEIVQTPAEPADFFAFWQAGMARLEKEVPLDPQVRKDEQRSASDGLFDWFEVSFATFGKRVYGWLSAPKGALTSGKKYPVRVQVPGAGFGHYSQDGKCVDGAISLFLTVFPFPPSTDIEKNRPLYDAFLKDLGTGNYAHAGITGEREDHFYYAVLLGINRAVNWLAAQPYAELKDFTYDGTSQGGGSGLALLALNRHFTRGVVFVPAMTGHGAHFDGHQDGWPRYLDGFTDAASRAKVEANAPYFDGVNFARHITSPIRFAVGFSDCTCAPHAVYAAYNACAAKDKAIEHGLGMGHGVYGRIYRKLEAWEAGKRAKHKFTFISPAANSPRSWQLPAAFAKTVKNSGEVKKATITVTSLGAFELFVADQLVTKMDGDNRLDFLRPGYTDAARRRNSYEYDLTSLWQTAAGAENIVSAFVAPSWYADDIIGGFRDVKVALAVQLRLDYADGKHEMIVTDPSWNASYETPFFGADIYWGEQYDARKAASAAACALGGKAEANDWFWGEVTSVKGAAVSLRRDLTLPVHTAYVYCEAEGAQGTNVFGRVKKLREYAAGEEMTLEKGETLVVDFAQNAAAIPEFVFTAAAGTELVFRGGEMLNDANGELSRGNDGPAGSVYRANFRSLKDNGALARYVFAGQGEEKYTPSFTFFGYRYAAITATGKVTIRSLVSIPVTSVAKSLERGTLETGVEEVNQLISNIRWGQYSNYVNIPTDCPQRDERLGWMADTQVFTAAAFRNADVRDFFRKWMDDVRDTQAFDGAYSSVSPNSKWGGCGFNRLGWSDAGVIVPYTVFRMTGDKRIIQENFASMKKFVDLQASDKYATRDNFQYADWLSYEELTEDGVWEKGHKWDSRYVSADGRRFWNYLARAYWAENARMMAEMAKAVGNRAEEQHFAAMREEALANLRGEFLEADGGILKIFRHMQTPALFALKLGIVTNAAAKTEMIAALEKNFDDHGGSLQTGFLGTSILMDAVTEGAGKPERAYSLLLNRKNPSWLYSVDQGATTIWERWNSYTKENGFGDVGMNSFNHYAYGAVLDWLYGTAAGIRPGPNGGFEQEIILKPVTDARLKSLKASYVTARGVIRSEWAYDEKGVCRWRFSIPAGTRATVIANGKKVQYNGGDYALILGPEAQPLAVTPVDRGGEINWQDRKILAEGKKIEKNFWKRYLDELDREEDEWRQAGAVDRVLLGDSITQLWRNGGAEELKAMKQEMTVQNIGISGDRTENILWRLKETRELSGYKAKEVVILAGTNNFGIDPAEEATVENVALGVEAIVRAVRAKQPEAKIVLMAIFPRGWKAEDPVRAKIAATNALLKDFAAKEQGVEFLDIGEKLLEPDGSISKEMFGDALHPTAKGYQIWREALGKR